MDGYKKFVQNNYQPLEDHHCDDKELHEECITSKKIDKYSPEEHKKNEPKIKNKVKNITVDDLAALSDEESDVEVLKIVSPPSKKVHFSNDAIKKKPKINNNIENNNLNPCIPSSKIDKITEYIQTGCGTWTVSLDDTNQKKKKIHKDVEKTFKSFEAELKTKIDKKFENLNNIKTKQPSKKDIVKHNRQIVDNDYLKIHNKRTKTEFNEPLYEDNKTLDNMKSKCIEGSRALSTEIVEKSSKPVENIDPTEFLQVAQTNLETEEMALVEDHLDDKDETEQEKLIAEAFADDDIINEFKYLKYYHLILILM